MIISSTDTLENRKITKYHGIVTGEHLIGANIYKDLFSGVRDVVGGRTSQYEKELEKAREIIINKMIDKTCEKNGNGIIGLNISYNNLGGTMGNTILVSGYGTAITYE